MNENDMLKKVRAGELAANNGTIIRTLGMLGLDYQYLRLRVLQTALADSMGRAAMCSAINYLADSGYILVRTVDEHAPASVSDADPELLEIKLSPAGTRIQRGVEKDPLIEL